MHKLVSAVTPLFAFLISVQALKTQQPSWAAASITFGFAALSFYRDEINICQAEIERRRKQLVGKRPLRGLTRHAFVLYLALGYGDHKSAAFLMVSGIGAIAAGADVLLEAL